MLLDACVAPVALSARVAPMSRASTNDAALDPSLSAGAAAALALAADPLSPWGSVSSETEVALAADPLSPWGSVSQGLRS